MHKGGNRFLTMQNELQNLSRTTSLSLNLKFKDPWRRKRIFTAEKSLIIKINSYIHIISLFFSTRAGRRIFTHFVLYYHVRATLIFINFFLSPTSFLVFFTPNIKTLFSRQTRHFDTAVHFIR